MNTKLLFTHALSPLHAGTGQGVGVIDLPIAREKATGIPFLPGSSVKGTLRDNAPDSNADEKDNKIKVFGPETNNADAHAGAAQFSDQHLLLLPIRSLAGTFAWVASPYLLHRFMRDASQAGVAALTIPPGIADDKCLVVQDDAANSLKSQLTIGTTTDVVLEDLDLKATRSMEASAWASIIANHVFPNDSAWQKMLRERFCIVADNVLSYLLNTATEITARIKLLEDTKTVQKGGLWYEEALPTETILYGLVLATPVLKTGLNDAAIFNVVKSSIAPLMQFGGKATVGRGLCRVQLQNGSQPQNATPPPPSQTTDPTSQPSASPSVSTPASGTTGTPANAPATSNQTLSQTAAPPQSKPPVHLPYTSPTSSGNAPGQVTVRPLGVKKP